MKRPLNTIRTTATVRRRWPAVFRQVCVIALLACILAVYSVGANAHDHEIVGEEVDCPVCQMIGYKVAAGHGAGTSSLNATDHRTYTLPRAGSSALARHALLVRPPPRGPPSL